MPFYAVRNGRDPGVYNNWSSCEDQVKGYSKAQFKKFSTKAEAWDFVNGGEAESYGQDTNEPSYDYSYTRPSRSYENSSYRNDQWHTSTYPESRTETAADRHAGARSHQQGSFSQSASSRSRSWGTSYDTSASKTSQCKGRTESSKCTDYGYTGTPFPDHQGQSVYTDGTCFGNGQSSARAGYGVYWGPNDPQNTSERLIGRQTNNRAEIKAAEEAVRQAKDRGIRNLVLHTDSEFLIKGATTWTPKWKENGWKLSTGGDVVNRHDFEQLDKTMSGMNIKWKHVQGHQGVTGNEAADRLANEGARKDYRKY